MHLRFVQAFDLPFVRHVIDHAATFVFLGLRPVKIGSGVEKSQIFLRLQILGAMFSNPFRNIWRR